jgi:hypothetical protein
MAYGFVYVLGNVAMPNYYKIGCTERAPHRRAAELSATTAIPQDFDVLFYIEIDDYQAAEKSIHEWLADFRTNPGREFFHLEPENMPWLMGLFRFNPYRSAYTCVAGYHFTAPEAPEVNPWDNSSDEPSMPPHGPSFGLHGLNPRGDL